MKTKTRIKSLIMFAISLLISGTSIQGQAFDSLDQNPQDIAYYRPGLKSEPQVKVIY